MENEGLQQAAIGGATAAMVVAIATGRMPRWLRVTLVVAVLVLACGVSLFAYRYATQPSTLTVAVGSADGDAFRLMSAIASRMAAAHSPVRLKVIDKGTALEATKAFAAGEADLATARGDIGDLSAARTVVLVTYGVVLIVTPPGSSVSGFDDLKGKTVGVVGGEVNRKVVEVLTKEYELERAKVQFRNLATVGDSASAQVETGERADRRDADVGKVPVDAAQPIPQRQAEARTCRDRSPPERLPPSPRRSKATNCPRARCAARRRFPTTI